MIMRKKRYCKRTPIDTIVIVGNGFDLWQGLGSSYSQFRNYYFTHRDDILKKLRIKKHTFISEDGESVTCSDVELIYGDPFHPKELNDEFWNSFETALGEIEGDRLSLFFGKENDELAEMKRSIKNAKRILTEAFCSWVASINVNSKDSGYHFGENCVFINFNYTDTLIKRFGVNALKEYHIHGEATDKKSIVFGHSSHPQEPENMLAQFGGRLLGLYYVDRVLYETDKHCQDNIQDLCMFLAMNIVMCEEVKNIYVLGHSMGPADIAYFDFLVRSTRTSTESKTGENKRIPPEDWYKRLCYAIENAGHSHEDIQEEYIEAVEQKYRQEQAFRNQMIQKLYLRILGKPSKEKIGMVKESIAPRTTDAQWHISYHSERDKQWIEALMTELGCSNFKLYASIDDCLTPFQKEHRC